MGPYWFVPEGDLAGQAQSQLEASAGEVWKLATYALAGVVAILAGIIWKDMADDKREAKEREARLLELLKKKGEGS